MEWQTSPDSKSLPFYLAKLPVLVFNRIMGYLNMSQKLLIFKQFRYPDHLEIYRFKSKILCECIQILSDFENVNLSTNPGIFFPQIDFPPASIYKNVGDRLSKRLERYDWLVRNFLDLDVGTGCIEKYKFESLTILNHNTVVCLHILVPVILLEDIVTHLRFRRVCNILSFSGYQYQAESIPIHFDCPNCATQLTTDVLKPGHFSLMFKLILTGHYNIKIIKYENFTTRADMSRTRECQINIDLVGNHRVYRYYKNHLPSFINFNS